MTLFATDTATWSAVALATIASIGSTVTAVLAYLRDRDKLKYDEALAEMGVKIRVCDEDRDKLRTQNGQQQAQINELYRLLGKRPPEPQQPPVAP